MPLQTVSLMHINQFKSVIGTMALKNIECNASQSLDNLKQINGSFQLKVNKLPLYYCIKLTGIHTYMNLAVNNTNSSRYNIMLACNFFNLQGSPKIYCWVMKLLE